MPRLHQRRAEARGRRQGQGPDLAIRQLLQKRLCQAPRPGWGKEGFPMAEIPDFRVIYSGFIVINSGLDDL